MMSKALGMRCVGGLCGVLASVLVLVPAARADVTTDVSGAVLVFPKVEWTGAGGRDTVFSVTNTSNLPVIAHCFYVNAEEVQGSALWQVTDFTLILTKKQPTHWVASRGRRQQPLDGCSYGLSKVFRDDCDGAGIDPGSIPAIPIGFVGELKCIEVDEAGLPAPSNSLKGEAVLRGVSAADVSKYSAIAIAANLNCNDAESCTDNQVRLDNTDTNNGEYNSCPNVTLINHIADGLDSPVVSEFNPSGCAGGTCPIRTLLTLVPCSQDFENLIPSEVTLDYLSTNEFEEPISGSFTVDCWYNQRMSDLGGPTSGKCADGSACLNDQQCITKSQGLCDKPLNPFAPGFRGSKTFFTSLTPADDASRDIFEGGVIGIAEEIHYSNASVVTATATTVTSATAAWNLQKMGTRFDHLADTYGLETANDNADTIEIPARF